MDAWRSYEAWNDALLDVVFPELEEPQPVYLDFEDDVLDGLATRMVVAPDAVASELAAVVASTVEQDAGPASMFARHVRRASVWARAGRTETPPFLALLGAFCLAAEQMAAGEGMSSSNYFGRLRALLGRPPDDRRVDDAYRRVAEPLWGEHNRWLVELDGRRGLPTAFALTHRFVGLTVSQALVRSADRDKLKDFFRKYGFAPGADVPPSELVLVLDSWLAQSPCPASSGLERLWRNGQARERIAQSAAVALAGWDGSVQERRNDAARRGGEATRGHMALALELGAFPRKRFALQALLYLERPGEPREATVVTANPQTRVELVPDLPGALGLGRDSSLHAGDVLEGVLQICDSLSGQTLERRPRRLVLFREDELSRRWVESPQVMLGDDVRILVHEDLVARLTNVLDVVARPGWEIAAAYPGQPDNWKVVTGVQVFDHPGDLIDTSRMDDLAPLVPLTSTQLKVAGGFALPGQVRGKWHSWAPPEIRAVSDAPGGFGVRLTDLHRFDDTALEDGTAESIIGDWQDDGTGVFVQPIAELELNDGDYRVELVGADGDVLSTTSVLLRTGETPDRRQWALLNPVSYGGGVGVLGIAPSDADTEVKGHLVTGSHSRVLRGGDPPSVPWWSLGTSATDSADAPIVRLTMPDADSCVYNGRHREQIDLVPTDAKGKPLVAWSYGRCKTCGLVRRYPTRLKVPGSAPNSRPSTESVRSEHHRVSVLPDARPEGTNVWAIAVDALLHVGGGSWPQLERIALQVQPTALFVDQFARTLEALGHLDIRRDPSTLAPFAWEVAPTCLAGTSCGLHFSGYWPDSVYAAVGSAIEEAGGTIALAESEEGPTGYYAMVDCSLVRSLAAVTDADIPVVEAAWQEIAALLPPLSELLESLPRQSDSMTGDISWFQPRDNSWLRAADLGAAGAYRVRRFSTLDVVRTERDLAEGTVARSTVQLSKHLAALMLGQPLMAYDSTTRTLNVPLGADLPGLYGRAVVAASGSPPSAVRRQRLLQYEDVPPELAAHLHDLFRK